MFISTYHKLRLSFIVLAAIIILRSGEQFLSRSGRAVHRPGIAFILSNGLLGAAIGILVITIRCRLFGATRFIVFAIRGGLLATLVLVIAIHEDLVSRLILVVILHVDTTDFVLFLPLINPKRPSCRLTPTMMHSVVVRRRRRRRELNGEPRIVSLDIFELFPRRFRNVDTSITSSSREMPERKFQGTRSFLSLTRRKANLLQSHKSTYTLQLIATLGETMSIAITNCHMRTRTYIHIIHMYVCTHQIEIWSIEMKKFFSSFYPHQIKFQSSIHIFDKADRNRTRSHFYAFHLYLNSPMLSYWQL